MALDRRWRAGRGGRSHRRVFSVHARRPSGNPGDHGNGDADELGPRRAQMSARLTQRRWMALCLAAMNAACASADVPGELLIVVQTDMSMPKDIDKIRVELFAVGEARFH